MTQYTATNNASSTLAGAVSIGASSITVQNADKDKFPIITNGVNHTYVTLEDASHNINHVKVTARASGSATLTVDPATVTRAWNVGDIVECRPLAEQMIEALGHVGNATAAHAASAISYVGSTNLVATDVEAALDELDTEKQPSITANGILKGDGAGNISAATADTDYATPALVTAALPAGAIVEFPATTAPTGYLAAAGQLVSRTTYAALWAFAQASGNIAGSDGAWTKGAFSPGDGSTTFRLPDLRGYFRRGYGTNGDGVASGAIGAVQSSQNLAHTHTDSGHQHPATGIGQLGALNAGSANYAAALSGSTGLGYANIQSSGGSEARPNNIPVLVCIKT